MGQRKSILFRRDPEYTRPPPPVFAYNSLQTWPWVHTNTSSCIHLQFFSDVTLSTHDHLLLYSLTILFRRSPEYTRTPPPVFAYNSVRRTGSGIHRVLRLWVVCRRTLMSKTPSGSMTHSRYHHWWWVSIDLRNLRRQPRKVERGWRHLSERWLY